MEYLIIDGYNVIGGWPELTAIMKQSPADARHLLLEALREYQSYTGQHIILVFDAYRSKGVKKTELFSGIEVRYTDYGQIADSLIESLVSKLAERKESIGVVTSDWAQQQIVLGKGARRWSSREFILEIKKTSGKISKDAGRTQLDRPTTELGSRIDLKARKIMQKMAENKGQS
jgi:hypothetical protein